MSVKGADLLVSAWGSATVERTRLYTLRLFNYCHFIVELKCPGKIWLATKLIIIITTYYTPVATPWTLDPWPQRASKRWILDMDRISQHYPHVTWVLIPLLLKLRAVGPRLWQQGYTCFVPRAWHPDELIFPVWTNFSHSLTQET